VGSIRNNFGNLENFFGKLTRLYVSTR
jgi:hypothetical protein